MALDAGAAVHTIELKAELVQEATERAVARAVVGNRTLIVQPTKAARDEAVTALS